MTAYRIVIAAGGTGGHFFPAEALAAELRRRGHFVALMTDARSGGLVSPAFEGCERIVLAGAGIAGRGMLKAMRAVFALAMGTIAARRKLRALGAAVVAGFGGYPSVAPVLGARIHGRRPRILLHEQNAVLGRANRLLSRMADLLALGQDRTSAIPAGVATEVTGNPVRPAIAALFGLGYQPPGATISLLILGGSLGARVFSDVVPAALAALPDALRTRLRVVQQCRAEDIDRVRAAYATSGIAADLAPFFADVASLLAAAHLVISRAGASSVAELAVAGRPSVLVPLPGAIDDHQTENARALAEAGGAVVVRQSDLTAQGLADLLGGLLGAPERLVAAAAAAATCGRPNAAATLADAVERLAARHETREHSA
ncbi:MAG: undecaprenyldiphospho-muramoylpentapeptide beta-N-acetylglucosaminyltransferase [Alphaproteobacteria bacterium]|nr:undecaprenyldiphospho-muramoylpentapeptide beta-N-acetylglucosaminyltransferase [Alphaproteobacteria bacterium]